VQGIPVEVVRKDIKNLHLGVYPPDGRVRVSVPLRINDEEVRLAVTSRLGWISKRQKVFAQQERQSKREMITGESHYYQGRRYRLDVIEQNAVPTVALVNNTTIRLRVRPGASRGKREAVLYQWYRQQLRRQVPPLIARWEPEIGMTVTEWRIKKMKTRWGTCNIEARRIWLNLELAKKTVSCLEYIVVHEMVHFLERLHNERFRELMDRFMPQWRLHRDELNQFPLAHEGWQY
jgi:hypothetical protein